MYSNPPFAVQNVFRVFNIITFRRKDLFETFFGESTNSATKGPNWVNLGIGRFANTLMSVSEESRLVTLNMLSMGGQEAHARDNMVLSGIKAS